MTETDQASETSNNLNITEITGNDMHNDVITYRNWIWGCGVDSSGSRDVAAIGTVVVFASHVHQTEKLETQLQGSQAYGVTFSLTRPSLPFNQLVNWLRIR
jgi:hypothetical protein